MATYKVLQDIEAEDKFLGPLTLKQFIFAAIFVVCGYLSFFFLTRHLWFLIFPLLPVMVVTGFLAFPWGRDQPTEVWLLAKLRFYFKPRRRIWDQTGIQELVRVTAPKKVEEFFSNNLSQTEVKSRLKALADTIDSRGWVVKNVDVNMYNQPAYGSLDAGDATDRLIDPASLPHDTPAVAVTNNDDIFANALSVKLDTQIKEVGRQHQAQAVQQMHDDPTTASDLWFMNQPAPAKDGMTTFGAQQPVAANPQDESLLLPKEQRKPNISEEEAVSLLNRAKQTHNTHDMFRNRRHINPLGDQPTIINRPLPPVTPAPDPATIESVSRNNDRTVERLAHEFNQQAEDDGEVVVPLR